MLIPYPFVRHQCPDGSQHDTEKGQHGQDPADALGPGREGVATIVGGGVVHRRHHHDELGTKTRQG